MNGLISTLPVSPPPGVASVASYSGSAVWPGARKPGAPSALSVMPLTGPVGVIGEPFWSTSWNDPSTTEPLDDAANCGPVSLTVPTNVLAGIGLVPPGPVVSTVSVTWRPVSSATIEPSSRYVDDAAPWAESLRAPGEVPEPPRTMSGTQLAGDFGLVVVQAGGRSMNELLPGPG